MAHYKLNNIMIRLLSILFFMSSLGTLAAQDPTVFINQMYDAIGGTESFKKLKDIEYTYTYRSNGKSNVSIERYIFDGEISYGKYIKNEQGTPPNTKEAFVQYFDGVSAQVLVGGKNIEDKASIDRAFFSRKTNFYWLFMMHKLKDPGIIYDYSGIRTVEGIHYNIVTVTFENNVGVAQDKYVLYINPYTHLVDQFLFNVTAVGRVDPLLMKVQYQSIQGVMLPVLRKYKPAKNWEGDYDMDAPWTLEICENIKVRNGFNKKSILK